MTEDTAKAITLAGTDVEGSALTYAIGTAPGKGVLSGTAPNLTYTPNLNATGPDSFTFTVNDGTATSAAATVSITITAVNDAPALAVAIPDQTATVGVAFSYVVPVGTFTDVDNASLTWSATGLPAWLTFTPATRTFSGTPAAGDVGTPTITVSVSDGSLSASDSFVLTVNAAANTAPTITTTKPAALTVNEDTAGTVSLSASDANGDTLTWSILTPAGKGTASVSGTGSPKTVTYTPTANLNGSDSFVVQVSDGKGGTDTITVNVTITAVNDVPSFTKGANQTVAEDAGARTVAGWATAISAGPSDEASQTLTFTLINTNTALFSAQPAVAANGTLTYTPAANASGSATVTVTLADSGGASSGSQTFTITVTAVNDPPVNLTAPTTSGKSTVGRVQTATSGTWSDSDGTVVGYAYQWQRALGAGAYADIVGATGTAYTPVAGDAGYNLRVRVTASDNGTPGTASSAAFSVATLVKGKTATPTVTTSSTLTTATPTIAGTSTAGATIWIYDGDVLIGTVMAAGSGGWTWTPSAPLAAGTHLLTITAELAPEGESSPVGPITVTVTTGGSSGVVVSSSAGSGSGGCGAGGLVGLLGIILLPWLRRGRRA